MALPEESPAYVVYTIGSLKIRIPFMGNRKLDQHRYRRGAGFDAAPFHIKSLNKVIWIDWPTV